MRNKVYFHFRDSYIYECAAYEVARFLGLDKIPPCVARRLWSRPGSLQLWIENATTGAEHQAESRVAATRDWARQIQSMRLFDALIRNFDRNQNNLLIDAQGRWWLIDHGRSFHRSPQIDRIERIIWCEREMWKHLKALDRMSVTAQAGAYLDETEVDFLLERRDTLVRHFEERIARYGEDVVLY